MIRISKTVIFNKCFLLILILPIIGIMNFRRSIVGFPDIGFISRILDYLLVLDIGIIFIYVLLNVVKKKRSFCLNTVLILIIYSYILIRTFLVAYSTERAIINVLIIIPFLDMYISSMESICYFTDTLNFINFLNFVSVILWHKSGGLRYYSHITNRFWGDNYLLGYDNGFIVLILPLICFNYISYNYTKRKKYLLNIFICIATEGIVFSAGSLIALVILFSLYIVSKSKMFFGYIYRPVFNITVLLSGFLVLVVFRALNFINNIAMNLFGKNLATQRVALWETGYQRVKENPIWGYGFRDVVLAYGYNAPHQMMLDWLLQGGLIEFIFFIILIFVTFYMFSKDKSDNSIMLYNGIFAFLLAYLAESYSNYSYYWIFLSLCVIANKIYKGTIKNYN